MRLRVALSILVVAISAWLRSCWPSVLVPHSIWSLIAGLAVAGVALGVSAPVYAVDAINCYTLYHNHIKGLNLKLDDRISDAFGNIR